LHDSYREHVYTRASLTRRRDNRARQHGARNKTIMQRATFHQKHKKTSAHVLCASLNHVMNAPLKKEPQEAWGTEGQTGTAWPSTTYTPFTRYNRLSNPLNNRLCNRHCTTDNRLNNRLHRVNKRPTGCQTGFQPVVKPVVQTVWRFVSC